MDNVFGSPKHPREAYRFGVGAAAHFYVDVVALLAFAAFLALALPSLHNGLDGFNRFQDDAFYYLVIAKNFLTSGIFTFDGSHPTNGFQPLWMLMLAGAFAFIPAASDPSTFVWVTKVLEALCRILGIAAALGGMFRWWKPNRALAMSFAGPLLLLLAPTVLFEQGMETTLAVTLLILTLRLLAAERLNLASVAFAILALCRLDSAVFILPPLVAFVGWRATRGDGQSLATGAKSCLIVAAPSFAVLLAYMGINAFYTGHAMPISGALKSSFPVFTWHPGYLLEPLTLGERYGWSTLVTSPNLLMVIGIWLTATFCLIAHVVIACSLRKARSPRTMDDVARALAIAVLVAGLLSIANLLLFQRWEKSIDPRYMALPLATGLFALGVAIGLLAERPGGSADSGESLGDTPGRSVTRIALFAMVPAFLGWYAYGYLSDFRYEWSRSAPDYADLWAQIKETTEPGDTLAATDAGTLAFWTDRRVVNLDGVVNTYAYQDVLRGHELGSYLARQGVRYIAVVAFDHPFDYTRRPLEPMYRHGLNPAVVHGIDYHYLDYYIYSYLYGVYSDAVRLCSTQEIVRYPIGSVGASKLAYLVYRFDATRNLSASACEE